MSSSALLRVAPAALLMLALRPLPAVSATEATASDDCEWTTDTELCDEEQETWFTPPESWRAKDFSLVFDGTRYHLFYIRSKDSWLNGEDEVDFGHASSADLIEWEYHAAVDLRGPRGSWNDRHLWAPHVVRAGGEWRMYFTGVSYSDDPTRNLQRIGLAISADLFDWQLVDSTCEGVPGNGCLLDAAATWSTWGSPQPWSGDCRDPFVFEDGDGYGMLLTVRLRDRMQAIAYARSPDGIAWRLLAPLRIGEAPTAESAALLHQDDLLSLFWTSEGGLRVAQAKGLSLPWSDRELGVPGFAAEVLVQDDCTILLANVAGEGRIRFRRLIPEPGAGMRFSNVVHPACGPRGP